PDAPKWRSQRAAALRRAIDQLQRADRVSPNNWANDCDRASATMRLAYYERSAALFDAAIDLLRRVVDDLRPGYGFALYEIGRTSRLSARFDAANASFDRALSIPAADRDVSDRRLRLERQRAETGDTAFP